jgi:hypothetical protein
MFEAVRGTSFQGDIALDDINLKSGECILPGKFVIYTPSSKENSLELIELSSINKVSLV